MRRRGRLLSALAGLVTATVAAIAAAQPPALSAVVGVAARTPPDARTVEFLGRHRFGTGVVIDGAGLVVTAGYLLIEASEVKLVLDESTTVAADIVAYDLRSGLGLVRAREPLDLPALALGDDTRLAPGAPLLMASYGGEAAVRPGLLTARRAFASYWEFLLEDALMVSPPHPRFAGAALIDTDGRLVGVGSLLVRDARGDGEQIPAALFVPVSLLREVLPALLADGRSDDPPRPWLGLYLSDQQGLIRVVQVADEGPALAAGIEVGDIIVGIDETPVDTLADFYRRLWASGEAGVQVSLDVLRGSSLETLRVTSADQYAWFRGGAAR